MLHEAPSTKQKDEKTLKTDISFFAQKDEVVNWQINDPTIFN